MLPDGPPALCPSGNQRREQQPHRYTRTAPPSDRIGSTVLTRGIVHFAGHQPLTIRPRFEAIRRFAIDAKRAACRRSYGGIGLTCLDDLTARFVVAGEERFS